MVSPSPSSLSPSPNVSRAQHSGISADTSSVTRFYGQGTEEENAQEEENAHA